MAGGGSKKGGGGGTINVSSKSVIDANSTSNSTSSLTSDSTSNLTSNLNIQGLDNVKLHSDSTVDMKPLQADFCLRFGLESLPSAKICHPVSRHFGVTIFGIEVVGFNYSVDDLTVIEDLRRRPLIISDSPMTQGKAPGIRITL